MSAALPKTLPERPVLVIGGPTASGKSGLALAWAKRAGGVVINADSMQVYADLRVVTACPWRKWRSFHHTLSYRLRHVDLRLIPDLCRLPGRWRPRSRPANPQ